ncbi:MAG TPA: 5'/3'-nucleotidase SurE [Treponema sp.]|nr:MAG: 5'/3'-nucleotidase SurE [Treponema sp. GWA1_62_8]OHE65056.1 MAG: 5'/3'-nucleotidase SurE [Treponema sp. GWC1_61_84]OHE72456.1 MAG: 5'/3'-nucleotidase SurE [Treponema sp. RIFOXYC1_FULL_61_9]HCM26041.1 5'/3'-nucleotidase SurE [Treponema sp.]
MKILLTNDDGIDCEGLVALAAALQRKGGHEIYILAPDGNRSGVSHSITLRGPIRIVKRSERAWSCSGTPADCAIVAALGGLPMKPDLVLSGINVGPNVGTDLVYSGTAAAARQASLHGIPAIALSLAATEGVFEWETAAVYIADNLENFAAVWMSDIFVNVNIPNLREGPKGILRTFPSRRLYNDSLEVFRAPDGNEYCFINGGGIVTEPETGSDWDAVLRGYASVSPVFIHPVVRRDACVDVPDHAAASARPLAVPGRDGS